jgi:release factor glutamine methyltransferase
MRCEETEARPGERVRSAIVRIAAALRAAGIDSPERDARALVGLALQVGAAELIAEPDRSLTADQSGRLRDLLARRLAREPVSRLRGSREFYGRDFTISPATLDPRPETETIVEAALQLVAEGVFSQRRAGAGPLRILDVGTGSGALLVTLLAEIPDATGLGTDISAAALEVARANAEKHGVAARAGFLQTRSLAGVTGPFDLLVANPPYIPTGDLDGLDPEVAGFDPRGALDGGVDGLGVYREIAPDLARVVPRGWCLFEVGADQAADVTRLLSRHAPRASPVLRHWDDLGGHTRCVAISTQV